MRRVSVTDPIAAARPYDDADAFELRLEGPDRCSPEKWVRAGVDATPAWIKRIAGHADGLGSSRIVESDPDVVVLEDSDPLMETVMVGRSVEPERRAQPIGEAETKNAVALPAGDRTGPAHGIERRDGKLRLRESEPILSA